MSELVYSERFLLHDTGTHPERKERLIAITEFLKEKGMFKKVHEPLKVKEKDLLAVHSEKLLGQLKQLSREGIRTGDNVFNSNTFSIAMLSAGAALKAARLSKKGFSFSLARPPGHHAGRDFFGGFCYLNNIAFAVRKMQQEKGFAKALIADFDMHCGNGTQDIFQGDCSVFYLSLHQNPDYTFPGTGREGENSSHVRNVSIERGTSDEQYLRAFRKHFSEAFDSFKPELVGISAGFDILCSDSCVGNALQVKEHSTFRGIGEAIWEKAGKEKLPCFAVLEGGYDLHDLPVSVFNFLNAFK